MQKYDFSGFCAKDLHVRLRMHTQAFDPVHAWLSMRMHLEPIFDKNCVFIILIIFPCVL